MKQLTGKALLISATMTLPACNFGFSSGGGLGYLPAPPQSPDTEYGSFSKLTKNEDIPLSGATLTYTEAGTSGATDAVVTGQPYSSSALAVTYNAATGSYTIRNGTRSGTFGSADLSATSNPFGLSFNTYTPRNESGAAYGMYRGGGTVNDVALTYTTILAVSRKNPDTVDPRKTTAQIVWGAGGFSTLASDMPRTGSATYTGPLFGTYAGMGAATNITGSSRLTADFGSGTVQSRLVIDRSGLATLVVEGSGSIQSSRFAGTLAGGTYSGDFDGGFFGPKAVEMAFGFSLVGQDGSKIAGAAAGRK